MRNILFSVIMLSAAFESGIALAGPARDKMSKADAISKWTGAYDSVSGRCGGLQIEESKITWGSCKDASAKLVAVSASEWVMQIDPLAGECGWAGFIVALGDGESGATPRTAPAITISAYQTLEDYKTANRFVQCSYFKKEQ